MKNKDMRIYIIYGPPHSFKTMKLMKIAGSSKTIYYHSFQMKNSLQSFF